MHTTPEPLRGQAQTRQGHDDYADVAVPDAGQHGALRVGITMGAWIIAMSTFFTGGVLASGLPFGQVVLAAALGQAILGGIGFLTGLVGGRLRVSMAKIQLVVFGPVVGRIIALGVAFVLGVGWFAWQLSFFGTTVHVSFPGHWLTDPVVVMVWGAAVTTLTVLFGFRLLSAVSALAVPAILVLSFYGLGLSLQRSGGVTALFAAVPLGAPMPLAKAIGLVIGAAIVGTVMAPDLTRFSRRPVAGAAAAAVGYALADFVILLCGAAIVLAARSEPGDLAGAMKAVGLGIPAFIVLIAAQWATNKGNLYSGALSFVALTGWRQRRVVVALGLGGLVIALAGIQNHFVPLLEFLGNFMPPIAGAMVAHVLLLGNRTGPVPQAALGILAGGAAGYAVDAAQLAIPAGLVAMAIGALVHLGVACVVEARRG